VALWESSGIDPRHAQHKDIEALREHEKWAAALDHARRIVDAGGMAVLLGHRGTGKTQLAVELIREHCRDLRPARYVRSRELGQRIREAYGSNASITERQATNEFVEPKLLVIDECQERPDTEHEQRTLTLILDKRYGAMRPTVLIANCTTQQFVELVGGSAVDRLKEGGSIITCNWKSLRGSG
jgi:DNA replication protein DnaC